MPDTASTPIGDLTLDLNNFRTVPQDNEESAINAMIAVSSDRFWALTESLIDDGYLPTESIIVLKKNTSPAALIVKEGNRRIAALKLIHGYLPKNMVVVPVPIAAKISGLTDEWLDQNEKVPCTIYEEHEAQIVDRIVTLAHGKGELAGRDHWNAIARARHDRIVNKAHVPYLELLEKYLEEGSNITLTEKARWAVEYPITVLEDAIKRIATRVGANNSTDLARQYPNILYRVELEKILHDIGTQKLGFKTARSTGFAIDYGIPLNPSKQTKTTSVKHDVKGNNGSESDYAEPSLPDESTELSATELPTKIGATSRKTAATPIEDQKSVKRQLKQLRPLGENRKKVVTLRDEAIQLDLTKTPLAFCFILRSMFEISAKAFCDDHSASGGPTFKNTKGGDLPLQTVLDNIYKFLTKESDVSKARALHGANVELNKHEGILSVTSMNQLIHNPSFSLTPSDICRVFANIFPLLEEMNR